MKLLIDGIIKEAVLPGFEELLEDKQNIAAIAVDLDGEVCVYNTDKLEKLRNTYYMERLLNHRRSQIFIDGYPLVLRNLKNIGPKWRKVDLVFKYKEGMDIKAKVEAALAEVKFYRQPLEFYNDLETNEKYLQFVYQGKPLTAKVNIEGDVKSISISRNGIIRAHNVGADKLVKSNSAYLSHSDSMYSFATFNAEPLKIKSHYLEDIWDDLNLAFDYTPSMDLDELWHSIIIE